MLKKSVSGVLGVHCRLTISAAFTVVPRLIRHLADLGAALLAERRVLARRGWAGEKSGLFKHPEAFAASAPFCEIPTVLYV